MKHSDLSHAVLNHLRHSLIVVNSDLRIILCNESTSKLWGCNAEHFKGLFLKDLFLQTPLLLPKVELVFQHQNSFHLNDYEFHDTPLKNKHIDVLIDPVFAENQQVNYVVLTFEDRSFIAENNAHREEEERTQNLSQFVAAMSHELQNPLGGIKGMLQLLKRDQEHAEISTEPVSMILGELGRIDRLLKELLLYSHPIRLKYKSFNLHALLDIILAFEHSISSKTIKFILCYDPSLPEIQCDYDKLHQVFLNLIRNATDFSPSKGKITLRTQYCRKWEIIALALNPHLEYYRIDIEDEGVGVLEGQQSKLFTPLFSTKAEGHGLGLSISKKIIDAHGGVLRYLPRSPKGAIFQVYIPRLPC